MVQSEFLELLPDEEADAPDAEDAEVSCPTELAAPAAKKLHRSRCCCFWSWDSHRPPSNALRKSIGISFKNGSFVVFE